MQIRRTMLHAFAVTNMADVQAAKFTKAICNSSNTTCVQEKANVQPCFSNFTTTASTCNTGCSWPLAAHSAQTPRNNSWQERGCTYVSPISVLLGCSGTASANGDSSSLAPPLVTINPPAPPPVATAPSSVAPPGVTTALSSAAPPVATTLSSAPPPNNTSVLNCAPLGPDECPFSGQGNEGPQYETFMVGSPVANCNGGTTTMDSVVEGVRSLSETWNTGLSIDGEFAPLKFTGSGGWSSTETRQISQSFSIHVPPGKKAVVIAVHKLTSGKKIGSTDNYPFFSNQQTADVSYSQLLIPCNETFNFPSAPVPGSAVRSPVLIWMLFGSVILVGMISVLLGH